MTGRRSLALFTLLLLVASTVPATRLAAAPPAICLAAGDSLAAGVGSTLPRERSAAALLCRWSEAFFGDRAELVTVARPGERTGSFRTSGQLQALHEAIERARRAGQPIRFVLVSLGGNDLLALRDASEEERDRLFGEFAEALGPALLAVRETIGEGTPLLALTLYDPTDGDPTAERTESWWIARFNEAIRQRAEAVGGIVVDLASAFRGHSADWTWWPVDVHPTNAGYEAIARTAWQALGWDRTGPAITIERPSDGSELERRYQTVRAVVTDPGGVEQVTLWVDGREIGTLDPLPSNNEWLTLWETPWPIDGPPITLEIRARDRAGNESVATMRILRGG